MEELKRFFLLLIPLGSVRGQWILAPPALIEKYQLMGCGKGDAIVAARAEECHVDYLVTENREFLASVTDIPFQIVNAEEILTLLERVR